jgi:Ca-activated chloride channel family protein
MNVIISSPRILYLWGLFLSLLVFLWTRKNKTTLSSFQFAELVSTNNNSTIFLRGYRLLIMLCIVCIFFILSWPKRAEEKQQISKSGIDIVIALDTSYSMEASDLTPKRLESAKRALQQFINTRISDRIWLVLFAGKPFTSVPLTFDYAIFEEVLARTTTMPC